MKKLNALKINVERIIKNEDLMTLKGGQYGECHLWLCNCDMIPEAWWGCYCDPMDVYYSCQVHCYPYGCQCTPSEVNC